MALQVFLSSSSMLSSSTTGGGGGGSWSSLSHQHVLAADHLQRSSSRACETVSSKNFEDMKRGMVRSFCTVRSSLDTEVPVVGQVTEVNQDTFWLLVNAAGDKIVVIDMYTQSDNEMLILGNLQMSRDRDEVGQDLRICEPKVATEEAHLVLPSPHQIQASP